MTRPGILVTSTIAMLAVTLTASLLADIRKPAVPRESLHAIPLKLGDWTGGAGPSPTAGELELLKATSYLSRTYRKDTTSIELSIAYYAMQRAGESMHTPKNCLPAAGWEISKYDSAEIPLDGRLQRINKFTVQNGDAKLLVLYWYQTRKRIINNEYAGKVFMVWDAITIGRTEGAVVKAYLPDRPRASQEAIAFVTMVMAQMRDVLGN